MSKHFHVWEDSIIKRKNAKMVFYSKQKDYRAEILKEWECEQKPQRADISDQVAYLDDLIENLKKEIVRIETKKNELLGSLFERHRDQFLKLAKEQDNAK